MTATFFPAFDHLLAASHFTGWCQPVAQGIDGGGAIRWRRTGTLERVMSSTDQPAPANREPGGLPEYGRGRFAGAAPYPQSSSGISP